MVEIQKVVDEQVAVRDTPWRLKTRAVYEYLRRTIKDPFKPFVVIPDIERNTVHILPFRTDGQYNLERNSK